jgi:hypothetical protein
MGTIGAGSPLETMFEVVEGVSHCANFVTKYHKSKSEIGQVVAQTEPVSAKIHQFEVLEQWIAEEFSTSTADLTLQALSRSLGAAKKEYVAALAFCKKCEQDQARRIKRVAWATIDARHQPWKEIATRLQEAESSFSLDLQSWNL